MNKAVLLVDTNSFRRAALAKAFAVHRVSVAEAPSLFQGIAALGRADFSVLLVGEGRPASMRGLCRLARKRHPSIHILVLQRSGGSLEAVRQATGVTLHGVDGDAAAAEVVSRVEALQKMPAPMEYDPLHTALVQVDVAAALAEEQEHPPEDEDVFAEPDLAGAAPGEAPLMEGTLDNEGGAPLLMGLFAQEATGTLAVDAGPARGRYRFAAGEPVGLDEDDDALWAALLRTHRVKEGTARPAARAGGLAEALLKGGALTGDALRRHLQDELKDRLRPLVGQKEGAWRFVEAAAAADDAPRVNPFSIILEHFRRSMSPDRLLVVGRELQGRYLVPGTALALAASKLAGFVKGADVAALINGQCTVGQFYEATRLDLLMGALVVLTLEAAQLVSMADKPQAADAPRVALARVSTGDT
ncbi:MAG: hypothetical protein HY904_23495 [Deltaproteobacteria bacterium]|nr:hypothetical protein [Deltaproteobacteria bacterium]